jgi:hypothetical protein
VPQPNAPPRAPAIKHNEVKYLEHILGVLFNDTANREDMA